MKRKICTIIFTCLLSIIYAADNKDLDARISIDYYGIAGCVYFNGFDFKGYKPEKDGIEPLLEETLNKLKDNYKDSKQPFVFVGHSQGGLRALAMSTYLKQNDPALYKQLRGVITLSGIDTGLKLLENKGSNARKEILNDAKIITSGYEAVSRAGSALIVGDPLTSYILRQSTSGVTSVNVYLTGSFILSTFIPATKDYIDPILYNVGWNNHKQVLDMCPQSEFIKKYVLNGSTLQLDPNLNYFFLVGTNSDTLSLADKDARATADKWLSESAKAFNTARTIHLAKVASGFGLFTNSVSYASDCKKAYNWVKNPQSEMNAIIGESEHDGLVAASSQQVKGLPKAKVKKYKTENHESISKAKDENQINALNGQPYSYEDIKSTVKSWLK